MSGLRGRAAPPWLLLRCACLALAPHRILPGFPLAGGSRQCWVCAADGSCARCQCPYRRLWQMRRGCCLVRFYSYAVPRTRAQCSSRCIPSQACLNPLLELVLFDFVQVCASVHAAAPATPLGRFRSWCGCPWENPGNSARPEACQSTPATSPPGQWAHKGPLGWSAQWLESVSRGPSQGGGLAGRQGGGQGEGGVPGRRPRARAALLWVLGEPGLGGGRRGLRWRHLQPGV